MKRNFSGGSGSLEAYLQNVYYILKYNYFSIDVCTQSQVYFRTTYLYRKLNILILAIILG